MKNNEQAFPASDLITEDGQQKLQLQKGMTLRDYFAAKALSYFLAPVHYLEQNTGSGDALSAKRAYEVADAMLKAREK